MRGSNLINKAIIVTALTTVVLSACGVIDNNNNLNDTGLKNRDVTEPTRVNNPYDNRNLDNTNDYDKQKNIRVRNNANNNGYETPRMRVQIGLQIRFFH